MCVGPHSSLYEIFACSKTNAYAYSQARKRRDRTLSKALLQSEEKGRWHLLDANGIAIREFAAALHRIVPTFCWQPNFTWLPPRGRAFHTEFIDDPALEVFRFDVQHGYSRSSIALLSRFAAHTTALLEQVNPHAPLICTTPFYAPVAQRWRGPVIYYLTDFAAGYESLDARHVRAADQSLSRVASLVCPNSRRLADYLVERAGCEERKIVIVPNATRRSNLRKRWSDRPDDPPEDLQGLPRPLIGIIGNMAGNLDWELIEDAVARTPGMNWVFVGPYSMDIACKAQKLARARLIASHRQTRFIGSRPYGVLHQYARAFDAAVMPYRNLEPTRSGSSTRFYEHLAACRPMLATRAVEELTRKEPLLRLVDSGAELADQLSTLEGSGFRDGFEAMRWKASQSETWDCRAEAMVTAFPRESAVACGR